MEGMNKLNVKSKIFKEISAEELLNIIKHYFPKSNIVSISLLKGGLFNTTYRLIIDSPHRDLILRIGPVNREYLLAFENNLMRAEEYVYKLLVENNIPSPTVIVCDTSKNIIDRDFMITEYIKSVPLSDESILESCKGKLYQEVGEYIYKLHSIKGSKFGRVSDFVAGISYDTWKEFLICHVNQIGKSCLEYDVFDKDTIKKINEVYKSNQSLFDDIIESNLVHADLWAGNILISENYNKNYEVTAIIDVDRAVFGDVDFEFASPWMINDDFISGYGNILSDESRQLKLKLYSLLYSVIDSYVWKVEYNDENEYIVNKARTLELLSTLM